MKKIAIVTGASSGMGREFALTLKDHGTYDEVWAVARSEERLNELKPDIPFPVKMIPLDLSKNESLEKMRELLKEEQPEVKILINAAGFGKFEGTMETSYEENLNMTDLNVRALVAMTQMTVPYMKEGGEILEFASVAAFQPTPYINVYSATKAFVLSYTRALHRELRSKGIHVMAVCPFWTSTRFFDRSIDPDREPVVKKYAAMYKPEYIVSYAWKALRNKKKDYCIPGFIAKAQVVFVKIMPHRLVMSLWMSQQKLK